MIRPTLAVLLALTVAPQALAASEPKHVKPDRAAINALLDEFVPAVVAQKDLKRGWQLVGGVAKTVSYREWLKGNTSVQGYPAKGTHFPGLIVDYSYPGDIGFDILLQPTKKSLGAVVVPRRGAEDRRQLEDHDLVPGRDLRPGRADADRARPERPRPGERLSRRRALRTAASRRGCSSCRWRFSRRSRSAASATASRAGRASAAACASCSARSPQAARTATLRGWRTTTTTSTTTASRRRREIRPLAIALALIVAFMAAEVALAFVADSLALLSDAAHMLIDAAALGMSVWAARLALRPAARTDDVRLPAGRDPRGPGERDHAPAARAR